jgi:hypothetical protein
VSRFEHIPNRLILHSTSSVSCSEALRLCHSAYVLPIAVLVRIVNALNQDPPFAAMAQVGIALASHDRLSDRGYTIGTWMSAKERGWEERAGVLPQICFFESFGG